MMTTPSRLSLTGTVSFDADAVEADGKPRRPTFKIVGYTGSVVNIGGFFSPVIVDLGGMTAARDKLPILRDHDTEKIVGQADRIEIDMDGVRLAGVVTGESEHAQEVVSQAKNGFEWQASIGASITRREFLEAGKPATVNGREVTGPLVIARETILDETSFVAIGADGRTSAKVAASKSLGSFPKGETTMSFEQWLEAKGIDPAAVDDNTSKALRAAHDAEQKPPAPPPPKHHDEAKNLNDVVRARREENERIKAITDLVQQTIEERPFLTEEVGEMGRMAIEAKSTLDQFKLAIFELRANAGSGPMILTPTKPEIGAKAVEAAVCMTGGLGDIEKHFDERTLSAARKGYPDGLGLENLLVMAARENGQHGVSRGNVRRLLNAAFMPERQIRATGFSTFDLPGILGSTANRFLRQGFMAVEQEWRKVGAIRSVRDFRQVTSYSLTGDFVYEEVGPGGEIKHGTIGEMSYTNQIKTYARMFAITRNDIVNDDLGALSSIPSRLGRGAAIKINQLFWAKFLNNSAFFTTARGNEMEGVTVGTNDSRLNVEGLTRAETAFYAMTDPDGQPMASTPTILLVPRSLSVAAAQLMNSTQLIDNTTGAVVGTTNPHAGKYMIVSSSYLSNAAYTGYSATAWYLLADPNDVPVIEIAFLNGRDTPIVESADVDFENLGIQMRGYHDIGVELQEYRGGVRSKGAA